MGDSGANDSPSEHDIRHALTRALAVTLQRYDGQPYTEAALLERITALPGRITPLGDGWWLVGVVHDAIAGIEQDVLVRAGRPPRLRLIEVPSSWVEPPPPVMMPETDHSRHLKQRHRLAGASSAPD